MEMQSAIKLLSTVNESITSIKKVLTGAEMLTPKTETEATELMANTVPASWEKQWEGPENPTAWIRMANKKGSALIKWVQAAQAKSLLKNGVNLSELFHPETFLNAFR